MKQLQYFNNINTNWTEFIYPLNNQVITKDLIKISLNLFWNQIIKKELSEDKVLSFNSK